MKYLANNGYYKMLTIIFRLKRRPWNKMLDIHGARSASMLTLQLSFQMLEPVCFLNDF